MDGIHIADKGHVQQNLLNEVVNKFIFCTDKFSCRVLDAEVRDIQAELHPIKSWETQFNNVVNFWYLEEHAISCRKCCLSKRTSKAVLQVIIKLL